MIGDSSTTDFVGLKQSPNIKLIDLYIRVDQLNFMIFIMLTVPIILTNASQQYPVIRKSLIFI